MSRSTDKAVLHQLVIELGLHVPSSAAINHASLEWRALRAAWIAALDHLGMTEAMAREGAGEAWNRRKKERAA